MKKILPLIMAAAIAVGCDNTPKFEVNGTIEGAEDSLLYLEAITLDGVQKLDSTKLKADGTFKFTATAPTNPEFYSLRIGTERINFSIDSTETVSFKASMKTMTREYSVEGSENCEKIREITVLQGKLQDNILALSKNESMYPGDIADSIESLVNAYKEKMCNEYIFKQPSAAYAYYAVHQSIMGAQLFNPVSDRGDVKCYAAVATAWDATYHEAERTKQLCTMAIKGMENTAQPQQKVLEIDNSKIQEANIIDIELPDVNAKLHKLTSLKGKVVLLDFTLYGEKESAERTRTMRTLYTKYKDRGFEIYQISLDNDTHFWKYSAENLPWICVHETDGRATNTYGVHNLPTFFLISRENEVVKRSDNMTGSLESEIEALL